MVQVNKKLAAQALLQQAAEEAAPTDSSNKKRKVLPSVLEDDRFNAMFEDPSYTVDEAAEEYKFHHPNAGISLLHHKHTSIVGMPCSVVGMPCFEVGMPLSVTAA